MYVVMSKLKDRIYPDNKHIIKFVMRKIIIICIMLFFGSNGTTEDT